MKETKKVETKEQMLVRKNAEIACLQARIRGIKSELFPPTGSEDSLIFMHKVIKEAMELCDIAINQAETFYKKDN